MFELTFQVTCVVGEALFNGVRFEAFFEQVPLVEEQDEICRFEERVVRHLPKRVHTVLQGVLENKRVRG